MTTARFGELVANAQGCIPVGLRALMENVVLVVEDRPSPEMLAELEITPPDTLYGLYEGTPLTGTRVERNRDSARSDHDLLRTDTGRCGRRG